MAVLIGQPTDVMFVHTDHHSKNWSVLNSFQINNRTLGQKYKWMWEVPSDGHTQTGSGAALSVWWPQSVSHRWLVAKLQLCNAAPATNECSLDCHQQSLTLMDRVKLVVVWLSEEKPEAALLLGCTEILVPSVCREHTNSVTWTNPKVQ